MNTGTIKLGNFIKLVIGILAGVLFLFLMFGANVRNTATSASIGENNRMTGELSAEAYATQYFIPTQPCVDSIGLLLEFEPESVADGCVSVWLYDETGKVVAGCRPEHITLKEAGPDTMSATVDVSEMMGSEIHLHVTCAGKDVVIRVPSTELSAENRSGMAFGTQINLTFPEDLIHLFDPETEKNLL